MKLRLKHSSAWVALSLIIIAGCFLVVPSWLESRQAPRRIAYGSSPVAISSWPVWPRQLRDLGVKKSGPDLGITYEKMASIADGSVDAMARVEKTLSQLEASQATATELSYAARTAERSAEIESQNLAGMTLPPKLRHNRHVDAGWKAAQAAAEAKVRALDCLQSASPGVHPWEQSDYLRAIQQARDLTTAALDDMIAAAR